MARHRKPVAPRSKYITPEGEQRLRDEVLQLWTVERPRVTREVSEAAALGDRSENAEYIYGKKRLREIDGRLEFLTKRIDELKVVRELPPPGSEAARRAFFGAWVCLEDEDGETSCYRIVGPDEFDPDTGQISMDAPMGRALLGKQEGDEVVVTRPKGAAVFSVVEIRYRPFDPE